MSLVEAESLDFAAAQDVMSGKHGSAIVTRFPPEPNGRLHIGHAKAICIEGVGAASVPDSGAPFAVTNTFQVSVLVTVGGVVVASVTVAAFWK